MDYKTFYGQHWKLVWTLIIGVPVVVLAVGSLVMPEVFWDGYLYKYLWGPVVADAKDVEQGAITEGYTGVSTATYAIVLAVAVLGIWRVLSYLHVRLDPDFLIAMVPWVVLGAVLRSLEDAGLFAKDGFLVYLFISPLIYILIGLLVLGLVIVFKHIENRADRMGVIEGFRWGSVAMFVMVIPSLFVRSMFPDELLEETLVSPLLFVTAFGTLALAWWTRRTGRVKMTTLVFIQGTVMTVASIYYVLVWTSGDTWTDPTKPLQPQELFVIPGLAVLATALSAGLYWLLSRRWPDYRAFYGAVALVLFAAHFLDGAATFRGLDVYDYSEKHVIPSLLIDLTGTAAVMLPLKFAVVSAVVYLLDVEYREDLAETPNLGWLVKVAILVLGLAPGIRDMLRLAMGV